ncbi:MAG: 16S rRNA (adenine(1518)-N(6)/adenine(1519)-N(6))-dimethyltransferase RsmA [Candidatus Omnitrophica bacterium]|nr:16S rRNA (adenine(1518)-N(6)/adenine(1519)-N(6))-dimethyltransferase RsmA [Candidatus Omnitrophota bacterium]
MRLQPKKRLGQVFLVNHHTQNKIIESVCLKPDDQVLEIGPGEGVVTRKIAPRVKKLVAVELDKGLCAILNKEFRLNKNVLIVHKDVLKLKFRDYFGRAKVKVIGNIPYYISTQIIEFLLHNSKHIKEAYLMLQKEFAQRIVSKPADKDRGSLSCFVQYYAAADILFYIKKGCFWPVPKVDSAFVRLKIREAPPVSVKSKEMFFKIIRASFMQRRKTLRNSLAKIIPREKLRHFFSLYHLDQDIRPQEMGLEDFAHLSNLVS